jgi:hypothetical protein
MHMMKPSALRENWCVPLGRYFSEKLLAPISEAVVALFYDRSVRGGGHNVSGNAVNDAG